MDILGVDSTEWMEMPRDHEVDGPFELVVFDLAGTILDHGSRAPLVAFRGVFALEGVRVTLAQASAPMGLDKRSHLTAMIEDPMIAAEWERVHGSRPTRADVDRLYRAFTPLQLEAIRAHAQLVPGVLDMIARLRARGVKIATTTGYFRDAAALALSLAGEQGFGSDADVCVDDVARGRPAPDMIERAMALCGVADRTRVVNVGDTVFDVEAGRRAGVVSVGVLRTSSLVGATADEWRALAAEERDRRIGVARASLESVGADLLLDSAADLADVTLGDRRRVA